MGYDYYDTPDGQDCHKKIWWIVKKAGVLGVFASTLDVMLISHPKGYAPTIARYGFITLPLVGISATFAATTCMSTTLRGKDDRINYLIGGAAAGSLVGVWAKSYLAGTVAAVACGIAGALKKDALIDGWEFFPERKTYFAWGHWGSRNPDFSFTQERPRPWKAAGEE